MNLNLELLSKNMKLLRVMHGLSQEALAEKINISRSTYTAYERCLKAPNLQVLDSLAALYDIGFDTLVFRDLSRGIFYRIYLCDDDKSVKKLLSEYESLTLASRNLIMEKILTLLEREEIFYSEYKKLPVNQDKSKKPYKR